MGDFNLAPNHDGWAQLRRLGTIPAITEGRTTLATTEGSYANLYDSIWYDVSLLNTTDSGILRFPDLISLNHQEARDRSSDHALVYLGLYGAELHPMNIAGGKPMPNTSTPDCIGLNTSGIHRLDELPQVGLARAEDIVEGRPWQSPEHLIRISGLGTARVQDIQASGLLCE